MTANNLRPDRVSEVLREIKQAHDLTQEDLARMLGTTQPAISRILKGKHWPSAKIVLGLLVLFPEAADLFLSENMQTDLKSMQVDTERLQPA